IPRPVIQSAPSSGAPLNSTPVNTTPVANSSTPTAISTDKAAVSNLSASVTSPALGASTAVTPQNQQLNNLQAQTTAIKISVAGQQVSLQGPANLPPLQNVQITRINGAQANIQWQQPSQPAALSVTPLLNSRQAQVVEQSLRQALPQQIPIAEGINQLVAQSVQIANSSSNINIPVDKIALSIMQLFGVKPGALSSSATIKRNVQHGGLFTESKLFNHSAGNQGDMKNFLSKLRQLAKQLPAEQKEMLINTTDRMLARVTASQLTHVQQQHTKGEISNERTFQIDIPVQQNEKLDNVEMEIKQRKHRNEQGEFISVWSVKLHFDLAEHGEVDAEVALNPTDNSISTTFFCTNLNTVHRIERAMPSFRQQLHQQGFEINTLHCTQGSQAAAAANNPINKRIIDIRT
ncbi:MAG: flagellar hook-length control protein FliK, partial [Pseudomonadales bacterium]|nr:flagellar hook-length control protein FliK [Pseudomonadales bacterium]